MFTYNKVASFRTRPNHLTRFADYPTHLTLRDEDIAFYGLLTYGLQIKVLEANRLPGTATFQFTEIDRDILCEAVSRQQNLDQVCSRLEVCTFLDSEKPDLIESEVYALGGVTEHGLQIIEKSEGLCSLIGLTRQQG